MRPLIPAIVLVAAAALAARGAPNPEPAVVPAVQRWTGHEGWLPVRGVSVGIATDAAEPLASVARLLREDLGRLGVREGATGGGGTVIALALGDLPPLPDAAIASEAYFLQIGEQAAAVTAKTPAGVFYGTRTLLQLIAQADAAAPALPRGEVLDYPLYQRRMLMLDVGRKPFPVEVLHDYLRMLAWFKMNELHVHLSDEAFGGGYTGFRIECDAFPGLASKDLFYTKKQLRELQDAARDMGISITPEIDMPGHARVFTDYWPDLKMAGQSPSYMDVTNTNTVERMKALLDEMIPIFDAPDFHIGTDEYRVGGPKEEKERLHEGFRRFINTMNAHVRSRGKNTRIWSGFEHMLGTTAIDPTVIIDMWETDNARGQIGKGHKVINSNHGRTYIVPGCHYYGVNNAGIYNGWEPWMVSGDAAKNPAPGDPNLLGGKLHVWNDQGPTGYTLAEIADLTLPSLMAFAEKLWGRKGSADYAAFQERAASVRHAPGVTVFDRIPAADLPDIASEQVLSDPSRSIPLPLAGKLRADLEYPWTLTLEVRKDADTGQRGVILSSELVEVCDSFARQEERTTKDPSTGKDVKEKLTRRGIGLVRAAGSPGATPGESHLSRDVSRVYADPLPTNRWVSVAVVGTQRRTSVYLDGKLAGEHGEQMVCPLARLGAKSGGSFVGAVRNLKVHDRALSPKEIGRAAGLDIPDNLAEGCAVAATATDAAHGFVARHVTDGRPDTRWSSGPGAAEQSVTLDLGTRKRFNAVRIHWEVACPRSFRIGVSDDGSAWREVAAGEAREGVTDSEFPETAARHLRISMSQPATQWGYSIWEAEVLLRRASAGGTPR